MRPPLIGISTRFIRPESHALLPVMRESQPHLVDTTNLHPAFLFCGVRVNYVQAVYQTGGLPILIPLIEDDQLLRDALNSVDALLLPGGEDIHPEQYGESPRHKLRHPCCVRDKVERRLAKLAYQSGKPILAICRGMQLLNVVLGGTLHQDISADCPGSDQHSLGETPEDWARGAHSVQIKKGSKLGRVMGTHELRVNTLHHQAINNLAGGLIAVGSSPDGIIEAVEAADDRFLFGLQWHPEMMLDSAPAGRKLFEHFIDAARVASGQASKVAA